MTDATILQQALALQNPLERKRFLASACQGNPTLLAELEQQILAQTTADYATKTASHGSADDGAPATTKLQVDFKFIATKPAAFEFLRRSTRIDSLGLLDHYEVLEVLGQGGFGTVFRAFDDRLQRVVAIKVLQPEIASTSPARKRFVREARAAAPIRHENVVQVYAIEAQDVPYLVMEYVPGKTLQQLLSANGPVPADDVAKLGVQIARGLAAAHAVGLIHRDIKPANILLDSAHENRIKITDFGLARAADDASLTQSGTVAGTPLFMSPEQARGEALDHRSDLFSLGSLLYTMCTGQPPFRAGNSMAVMKRVVDDAHRPLRDLIPETPAWLCEIIDKLLKKNPAERFQSASEVVLALEQRKTTQPPPPKRTRSLLLGALVAALFGAVAIYFALRPTPVPEDTPERRAATVPTTVEEWLTSPDYIWSPAENLGPGVNTGGRDAFPSLTDDELTLVYWHQNRVKMSRRKSKDEPFPPGVDLPDEINDSAREPASISGDGRILVFVSNRQEGRDHLWLSERASVEAPFGEPKLIPAPVLSQAYDVAPCLSADGLTLLCTSLRPRDLGKGDIVMFTRKSRSEPFGNPAPMGEPVNTAAFDVSDWISPDGRVLLATTMPEQNQFTRCFLRAKPGSEFGPPQALGGFFNTIRIGHPWLSPDGQRIYFHSREIPNGLGELDLWMSRRIPKP